MPPRAQKFLGPGSAPHRLRAASRPGHTITKKSPARWGETGQGLMSDFTLLASA